MGGMVPATAVRQTNASLDAPIWGTVDGLRSNTDAPDERIAFASISTKAATSVEAVDLGSFASTDVQRRRCQQ